MFLFSVANYQLCVEKVKYKLIYFGYNIWKIVCEGCGQNHMPSKLIQHNSQAKYVLYENLHTADFEKMVDLISRKEIWDRLQIMYGEKNSIRSGEWESKRINKKDKKESWNKEFQPNDIFPPIRVQQLIK